MLRLTSPNYREYMDALFGPDDAALWIAVPGPDDDKYSRGVLGVVTGSARYPGAAVLGVDAALHTGVGMVRYLGAGRPTRLVLGQRPEAVTADGRVQAWLLGSGQEPDGRDEITALLLETALTQPLPTIIDGGALDLHGSATGPLVLTPHARELGRLLGADPKAIAADTASWAQRAATDLGHIVLLKGHTTHVASPDGSLLAIEAAPNWLATAGAGDALGGIMGALLATHSARVVAEPALLAPLSAAAAVIHGMAADRASNGGPFTILDLNREIPRVVAELLRSRGS
jgi:ADP-dependent NAD(P)H-hydrate dehydratase / NAD(P)H-hydrate epimerase